jgi:acyl carrier protein phosphodiesterase
MNHLGHFYLSFEQEHLLVGNYLADFSLGKRYEKYPKSIQNGVLLHRFIDDYTDNHPFVIKSKARIAKKHGKYSPVVIDVFYDYLLATDWNLYSNEPLSTFAAKTYTQLDLFKDLFPEKLLLRFEHMKTHDWLSHYATDYGIERSLLGLSKRAMFTNKFDEAFLDLKQFEQDFRDDFNQFFPQIIETCKDKIISLKSSTL